MMNKLGWYALLIAMCGDLLFSLILSFGYKGYNNLTMSISALGNPNSPVRLPFNIWMILEGLLFLISIPVFYKTYHPVANGLTITTLIFIAVFANTIISYEGLWQRLNLLFMYAPLAVMAIKRIL